MISKPPSNWSDEDKAVTAAQSAVAAAKYATGATKRGFSLLKGIVLGVVAAFWGFAGLAQFMLGGLGSASAAGGGMMVMLLAAIPGYFAWRNLKKAVGSDAGPKAIGQDAGPQPHRFAPEPARFSAPGGGQRREVQNSQAQLVKNILFSVVWIAFGVYLLQSSNSIVKLVGLVAIICGPILALKALRGLMGDFAAFSYDGEGIVVPGWFGEKHLAWRDVSDFSVKTLNTYAYGIIPVSSQHSLYACKTGGGKMLLPTQFTGLGVEALHELAAQLQFYRSGVMGAGPRFSQGHTSDYSSAAPTPSPSFGRIDTGLAPTVPLASRPGPATAPSFGRRQGVFGDRVS